MRENHGSQEMPRIRCVVHMPGQPPGLEESVLNLYLLCFVCFETKIKY